MAMLQHLFRTRIEIPDDDARDIILFVDCSLVLWPLIVARLSNFDANRNFLEVVDTAFITSLVLPFHESMLLLAGGLKRRVIIVYVADSAPPPFKKTNRANTHVLPKHEMERMTAAGRFTKTELFALATLTADTVLDAILADFDNPLLVKAAAADSAEDAAVAAKLKEQIAELEKEGGKAAEVAALRKQVAALERLTPAEFGKALHATVHDGAVSIAELCKLTRCALQFDAWNTLLEHRKIATDNRRHLHTATAAVSLELLATLLSPVESHVWETVRDDSRMRRALITMANEALRAQIMATPLPEAFASTMLVGARKCYCYRGQEFAMGPDVLSEADDILMRLTHDPAYNYVIVGNDSDTAGYYFLHHTEPSASRTFWLEDWRKMHVYELSAMAPPASFGGARSEYLQAMVFLWVATCGNDFITPAVSTTTVAEMVPRVMGALCRLGGAASWTELWDDAPRFAKAIDAWIAGEPRSTKGLYRFVVYPDGTRKKQAIEPAYSTGEQISQNLYYWSKKQLFLFNKT